MMKRILIAIALILFVGIGVHNITDNENKLHLQTVELKSTATQLKLLDQKYDAELQQKTINEQKVQQLEKEKQELQKQLQAKRDAQEAEKARIAAAASLSTTARAQSLPAAYTGACGDNEYAHFIYMKESGCNLNAVNSIGCRGIGQACPGSKLPCGADYACQNAFFTNYANARYGGWAGAYNAWLRQHWW